MPGRTRVADPKNVLLIVVDQWRGLTFVSIDPVEPLTDQLGGLPDELADEPIESYTATDSARIEFDANWKVYTDNFVEGYHIPGIHRSEEHTSELQSH